MKVYLIADTHFNHANIATYCDRPPDFSERILKNLRQVLTPEDTLIHIGDVYIGKKPPYLCDWPGRKILVRGNHDQHHSCTWWMEKGGFDFACDAMEFRGHVLTHEPLNPENINFVTPQMGAFNIHGHLHNIWHGFHANGGEKENESWRTQRLRFAWQLLFAIEYTNYMPVEFEKFTSHPDRYQARGPRARTQS